MMLLLLFSLFLTITNISITFSISSSKYSSRIHKFRNYYNRAIYSSPQEKPVYFEDVNEIDRAIREENTMLLAPRREFNELNDITSNKIIQELDINGVARINNVLSLLQTQELLKLVNSQWITSKLEISEMSNKNNYFANSKAQNNRWDLKLPFSVLVNDTLKFVLRKGSLIGDTLQQAVGGDGRIMELAAFITIEGADRQIVHSDTFWSKIPALYTCTIALQDVDEAMGPTVFIPNTHTEEAFITRATEFMADDIDKVDSELLSLPHTLSLLLEGQAALYDSRLLHCGGANRSHKPRVLFYFTIANPLIEDDDNDLIDPEGVNHNLDDIGIYSSIKSENIGYTLKDFRF